MRGNNSINFLIQDKRIFGKSLEKSVFRFFAPSGSDKSISKSLIDLRDFIEPFINPRPQVNDSLNVVWLEIFPRGQKISTICT